MKRLYVLPITAFHAWDINDDGPTQGALFAGQGPPVALLLREGLSRLLVLALGFRLNFSGGTMKNAIIILIAPGIPIMEIFMLLYYPGAHLKKVKYTIAFLITFWRAYYSMNTRHSNQMLFLRGSKWLL